jgi:hypothetical protein
MPKQISPLSDDIYRAFGKEPPSPPSIDAFEQIFVSEADWSKLGNPARIEIPVKRGGDG